MARGLITAAGTGRASLRKHSPRLPSKQTQPLNFVNTTHFIRTGRGTHPMAAVGLAA